MKLKQVICWLSELHVCGSQVCFIVNYILVKINYTCMVSKKQSKLSKINIVAIDQKATVTSLAFCNFCRSETKYVTD
jgi:hypothetical protein